MLLITIIDQYSFTSSLHETERVDDTGIKSFGCSSDFEKGKKFSRISSRSTSKAEFHAPIASQALYRGDCEATHHAERGSLVKLDRLIPRSMDCCMELSTLWGPLRRQN